MILSGEKTWEMRSRATSVRGEIALIAKGTGKVVGVARLVDSYPPLTPEAMQSHFTKHRIPAEKVAESGFKWFTPWVLVDLRPLETPIPYEHPSGAVTWVNLSADEEAAVLGSKVATNTIFPANPTLPIREEELLAQRVLAQLSKGPAGVKIPNDASTSVRRKGNKLYIDVEWEDGSPPNRSWKRPGWLDSIGIFGVVASAFCMLAFLIHLPLAILTESFTLLGAFKWFGTGLVAMIVAVIGGRSGDLDELFGSR
jgi:hypothetical protein